MTTDTIRFDSIIDALDRHGCEPRTSSTGIGKSAICPAHSDTGRHLEVRRRAEGIVVIRCRECAPEQVLAALDLEPNLLETAEASRRASEEAFDPPALEALEEPEPADQPAGLPAVPEGGTTALNVPRELPDLGPRLDFHGHRYDAPADLTAEQWTEDAKSALALAHALPFVLGDVVNTGLERWEDVAIQVLPEGLASETLMKYARIAAKIPAGERVEGVSFSQHRMVAYRPEQERRELLERSATCNWTTVDLRAELAQRRALHAAPNPQPEVEDSNPAASCCPTCGRPYERQAA